jgi:hypothetical protein
MTRLTVSNNAAARRPFTATCQSRPSKLIESWRQKGRLGEPGSATEQKRIPLLFGDGGVYELQDLRARSAMLGLLSSSVQKMHQDLEMLIRQVLIQEALTE